MLPSEAAIYRIRRDLTLNMLLKFALVCALFSCFAVGPENARIVALLGVVSIWFWLNISSARGSRTAAASPSLIAAGQFEEAEKNIEHTVRSFSWFRGVKLQALHHLALLRHAQRRWQESAALSRALLRQRLGPLQSLNKTARLLLADSLLEMNDLHGAHEAMVGLLRQPLTLGETLNLLTVQLDYLARIGAWPQIMEGIMNKVQLAELLPAAVSARVQAFMALAAKNVDRPDFFQWLRDRAALLADVQKLVAERPILRELWDANVQSQSHG